LGLEKGAQTQEVYWVPGFHTVLQGKNGAGDQWYTDGRLGVAVLLMGRITPVEVEIVRDFSSDPSKRTGIDKVGSSLQPRWKAHTDRADPTMGFCNSV
jgi:hypothetical protein